MRADDTPPTTSALDRRREHLLVAILASPKDAPKRTLLPPLSEDDSSRHQVSKWFRAASGNSHLVREGQLAELVLSRPRNRTP